jgi:hypothetical protein
VVGIDAKRYEDAQETLAMLKLLARSQDCLPGARRWVEKHAVLDGRRTLEDGLIEHLLKGDLLEAQGEISLGKNVFLRRATAGCTPPEL